MSTELSVNNLRFRYRRGAEELFDGFTHTFRPGIITALTGASGRGKSTLLYVLGLLLTPSSGQVMVDGKPASTMPDQARSQLRAAHFGFVFQDSELDPSRTILDSVVEPGLYAGGSRAAIGQRATTLLEQFGLAERAHHRPGQISGGQAQRVALARALVGSPGIILADEPTGNLDPDTAEKVLAALERAACESRVVVIATHDPMVTQRAKEVLQL